MFLYERAAPNVPAPPVGDWDPAITIPTLVGSLLSFCATTTVILCWLFLGGSRRREFRYALILNLTFAELINTLNNSISGLVVASTHEKLGDGIACDFNGWVGQMSVQAVDFSILAVSVVTLLTIQLKSYIIYASIVTKTLICVSIWIVPLTTSILAWRWNIYEPVTGNWCWIGSEHQTLRYALTHGWRYGIIIISFCIYVFVFAYMHRKLKGRSYSNTSYSSYEDLPFEFSERRPGERDSITYQPGPLTGTEASRLSLGDFQHRALADDKKELDQNPSSFRLRRTASKVDRDVWQMVLLNLYPVTYLILWLPGLANRIAEANGHNLRSLSIMQCSTQYIGLANACVYMYKEHRKDIREWFRKTMKNTFGESHI